MNSKSRGVTTTMILPLGVGLLFLTSCVTEPKIPGSTALTNAIALEKADKAAALIAAGADVNARDHFGMTPLMWAGLNGENSIAQALIDKGADVNAEVVKDGKIVGGNALMGAARKGRTDIAQLLLAHGANPNARTTTNGMTAIMIASFNNHPDIVRLLESKGSGIDEEENQYLLKMKEQCSYEVGASVGYATVERVHETSAKNATLTEAQNLCMSLSEGFQKGFQAAVENWRLQRKQDIQKEMQDTLGALFKGFVAAAPGMVQMYHGIIALHSHNKTINRVAGDIQAVRRDVIRAVVNGVEAASGSGTPAANPPSGPACPCTGGNPVYSGGQCYPNSQAACGDNPSCQWQLCQ